MKRTALAAAMIITLFAITAQAQTMPSAPGPEAKKLGVFLGTWADSGKTETSPFGKGGATSGTMTCAWFSGGYQLVCDANDESPMGKVKSHSIYGYNVEKKQYYNFGIDSGGFGGPGTVAVEGSTWTFAGSDTMGGKVFWFRTIVKLVSPNEITYRSEYSEDNKAWKLQAEGKMAKK